MLGIEHIIKIKQMGESGHKVFRAAVFDESIHQHPNYIELQKLAAKTRNQDGSLKPADALIVLLLENLDPKSEYSFKHKDKQINLKVEMNYDDSAENIISGDGEATINFLSKDPQIVISKDNKSVIVENETIPIPPPLNLNFVYLPKKPNDIVEYLLDHYINTRQILRENQTTVYYKENKHGDPLFSKYEAAFTELAGAFLSSSRTPEGHLVVDEKGEVLGFFVESIEQEIKNNIVTLQKKEPTTQHYTKSLNKIFKPDLIIDDHKFTNMDNEPTIEDLNSNGPSSEYYFFHELKPGAFATLLALVEKNKDSVSIDMSSLAAVLGGSFTLEEDDLHKGNFGFYITEKGTGSNKKYEIHFFKIDHDMMFYDSITSRLEDGMRKYTGHEFSAGNRFPITRRDLENFPDVEDALMHYWPTQWRVIAKGDKKYSDDKDIAAFKALKDNPDFKKYKWQHFLKHILMNHDLIEHSLDTQLDSSKPENRSEKAMIAGAMLGRLAELKAVLLTVPDFRNHFIKHHKEYYDNILKEWLEYYGEEKKTEFETYLQNEFVKLWVVLPECQDPFPCMEKKIVDAYQENSKKFVQFIIPQEKDTSATEYLRTLIMSQNIIPIENGDTPLHVAIKTNCYRGKETLAHFAEYLNVASPSKKTPLFLAIEKNDVYLANALINAGAAVGSSEISEAIYLHTQNNNNDLMLKRLEHANPECFQTFNYSEEMHKGFALPLARNHESITMNDLKKINDEIRFSHSYQLSKPALQNELELKLTPVLKEMATDINNYKRLLIDALINPEMNETLLRCLVNHYGNANNPDPKESASRNLALFYMLKNAIREISISIDFPGGLPEKKNAALHTFKAILASIDDQDTLKDIKTFLETSPDCDFIKQLTSDIGLIRKIRGTHGMTSTLAKIIHEIENKNPEIDIKVNKTGGVIDHFVLWGNQGSEESIIHRHRLEYKEACRRDAVVTQHISTRVI